MTTAAVFDWLVFGWIYYLIAYGLFPIMLLLVKKFLETNDLRYALINGLVLAVSTQQPSFILVFPLVGFIFGLFESRGNFKLIKRTLIVTLVSFVVWLLTILFFFTAYNNATVMSYYQGDFLNDNYFQFSNLFAILNPVRIWGSTFNYQFETYFPQQLIIFSFLPIFLAAIGVLMRPRDKRVVFCLFSLLFALVAYGSAVNMPFYANNLPYGSIFQSPSIFLVPASLGLALLIGYAHQGVSNVFNKFYKYNLRKPMKIICSFGVLTIIVLANIPWWTGQVSGQPLAGAPTKLNLYEMPSSYRDWARTVNASTDDYFILYMGLGMNSQIIGANYFSGMYQGVNGAIFTQVNTLPTVSFGSTNSLMYQFLNHPQVGKSWGSYSIKYIVFYTNVDDAFTSPQILDCLSQQDGIIQIANLTNVIVFEDKYVKPIVYSTNPTTEIEISYHDPTTYSVSANSTTPFTLVLNQAYSTGWTASVNGKLLATTSHENFTNFNSWNISDTGSMTIKLYYQPQTAYFVSILFSIGVISTIIVYVIFVTVRNVRRARLKTNYQKTYLTKSGSR